MNKSKIDRKSFINKTIKSIVGVSLLAIVPFKLFKNNKSKLSVVINKDAVKRNK